MKEKTYYTPYVIVGHKIRWIDNTLSGETRLISSRTPVTIVEMYAKRCLVVTEDGYFAWLDNGVLLNTESE